MNFLQQFARRRVTQGRGRGDGVGNRCVLVCEEVARFFINRSLAELQWEWEYHEEYCQDEQTEEAYPVEEDDQDHQDDQDQDQDEENNLDEDDQDNYE
jgi:hypothetical protein